MLCPFSTNPKLCEMQSNPAQRLCNPRIGAWTFPVAQDNGLQTIILISHLVQSVAKLHHQTLPKSKSSDANVKLLWNHILTDLPALTLHGGRRRTCNIHRAYTKQHILLLVKLKNPWNSWQIQESFDPTFWKGQGSSIIYVTHDRFWYIVSPSLHLILGNEFKCQRLTSLKSSAKTFALLARHPSLQVVWVEVKTSVKWPQKLPFCLTSKSSNWKKKTSSSQTPKPPVFEKEHVNFPRCKISLWKKKHPKTSVFVHTKMLPPWWHRLFRCGSPGL